MEYLLVREERQAGGRLGGRGADRERRARLWPCLEGWRRTPDTGLVWGPSLRVRLEVGPPRRQGAGHSAVRGERRKAGQGGPEGRLILPSHPGRGAGKMEDSFLLLRLLCFFLLRCFPDWFL